MKKILAVLFACLVSTSSFADTFKIISSFPAGSGPDRLLREYAEELSVQWRTPVVVDPRPGAAGSLAMNAHLADPANSVLAVANGEFIGHPILNNNATLVNQLKPLSVLVVSDLVLATSTKTENFDVLKARVQKKSTFGSWGVGTLPHVAGLQFSEALGSTDVVHAPYIQYGPWFVDIASQKLDFSFVTIASTRELEKAGKLKYIAVLSTKRNSDYPNVPTMNELVGNAVTYESVWFGLYASKSLPADRLKKLEADTINISTNSEKVNAVRKQLYYQGMPGQTVDRIEKMINDERARNQAAFKKYNISIK